MDLSPQLIWDRASAIPVKDAHLAALSGIDRSYFSRIRNGALGFTLPQFVTLERLLTDLEELKCRAGDLPVDYSNIGAVKAMLENLEREKRNPPGSPTKQDWDLLSLARQMNDDPAGVAANLGCTMAELSSRIAEATRRFDFELRTLRKSSEEAALLTQIRNEETAALRSK
jgi:hypothetical protein